jgi:hypothetical protein
MSDFLAVSPQSWPSSSSGWSTPMSDGVFSGFAGDSDSDTTASEMFEHENSRHDRLGAWFLGPKAENINFLKDFLHSVADQTERARLAFQPDDPVSHVALGAVFWSN